MDDKWREKNICHTCRDRDICNEGKKRNYTYGSIVVNCTMLSKQKL